MPRPPVVPPIGLRLARTARVVSQAFERAMTEAGGSASTWQVLLLVRSEQWGTQARIAEAMGISSATLTHHLNALEARARPPLARGRQPARPADGADAGRGEALRALAESRRGLRRAPALATHRRPDRAPRGTPGHARGRAAERYAVTQRRESCSSTIKRWFPAGCGACWRSRTTSMAGVRCRHAQTLVRRL